MKTTVLTLLFSGLLCFTMWAQEPPMAVSSEEPTAEPQTKPSPWSSRNAIGLRLGSQSGISYQRLFKNQTRLELNLHFGSPFGRYYDDIFDGPSYDWDDDDWRVTHSRVRWMIPSLSAAYQWTYPIGPYKGWRWYVGPGAGFGAYHGNLGVELFGQIGFEYTFKRIPLQLAFDYKLRALTTFISYDPYFSMGYSAFAVSVRFVF